MKTTGRSGRRAHARSRIFQLSPSHWARKIFQPSRLAQLLRDAFSRRPPSPRRGAESAIRRQSYTLEALEPRLLLSADLSYTSFTTAHDFTLKAEAGNQLTLYQTGTTTSEGSVTLAAAGDVDVAIERGLSLGALNGDTVRIDLDTFSLLNSFITGNGGKLSVTFGGGDQRLTQDLLTLEGTTGAVGFGLSIKGNSSISSSGTASITGDLAVTSEQSGISGVGVSSEGLLANANTGITLTSAHLTASGNLTLSAHSNVNVNTSGAETGNTTSAGHSTGTSADGIAGISLITSFNSATIDIGSGSVLAATSGDLKVHALRRAAATTGRDSRVDLKGERDH